MRVSKKNHLINLNQLKPIKTEFKFLGETPVISIYLIIDLVKSMALLALIKAALNSYKIIASNSFLYLEDILIYTHIKDLFIECFY